MVLHPPIVRTKTRNRLLVIDRRMLAAIAVVGMMGVIIGGYTFASYNSVNGTHPEIVSAYRSISTLGDSVTFYIDVHVWSWAGSLDTYLTSASFALRVDTVPFGALPATKGSFHPYDYLSYNLKFENHNFTMVSLVTRNNPVYVQLTLTASVDAGWYRQQVTRSDSVWIWQ